MTECDTELVVYGAGGHGRVVADAAEAQGWSAVRFADGADGRKGQVGARRVIAIGVESTIAYCHENKASLVVAIGDNRTRASLYQKFVRGGVEMATVKHPNSCIARGVSIASGTVVLGGVVINTGSVIGVNNIINTQVSLDHDNCLADHVHISPGSHTGGAVVFGEGVHLGVGCSVRNNISIGSWSVLGVGSVVVRDVPDSVVAYGNPARVVRSA